MKIENKKKISFIMHIGKMLHNYGASSDRIEAALYLMAVKLKLKANFFSIPTGIFGSFREETDDDNDDDELTRLIRLDPGGINLSKLFLVDKTIDLVLDGRLSLNDGRHRLKQIENAPPLFNALLEILAQTLIAACIAVVLKGSIHDVLASLPLGLVCALFGLLAKNTDFKRVHEVVTPFVIGLMAYGIHTFVPDINTKLIILASVLYLLPGLDLTTSLSELASQNLTSGTARFMGALMVLLKMSFGVYTATQVAKYLGLTTTGEFVLVLYPIWLQFLILALISLCFLVAFQARIHDAIWIIFFSCISHFSNSFFSLHFNEIQAPFLAGCIISAMSNLFAKKLDRPSLIFTLPAIILLVPGSIGFQGLNFMHEKNFIAGIEIGFKAISIAAALVTGLFVGNLIIRPKRTL